METPTAQSEIQLKVAEAIQDDVNKGIVRIDSNFMREAGVRPGDIVELAGQRKTVAIVDRAYPGDIGLNIIRMDGLIRHNAKTAIGDHIVVRKADVKEAKKVEISPARTGLVIKASPTLFKQGLLGRAVVKGDVVSLGGTRRRRSAMSSSPFFDEVFSMIDENLMNFGFGDLKFIVASAAPKQAVIITDKTEVVFNPEAVEVRDEEKTPEVMYEDIGGLSDEIKKIREMVELPLKHPEIFERLGIEPPKGVLLHGPPGTGKTLLAKAVANETNSHFICINGPEVMSKYYGQSLPAEERVLVLIDEQMKRIPIGDLVAQEPAGAKAVCFDKEGKVVLKEISSYIKHKTRSSLVRIRTASGRSITVTDDHSVFTVGKNGIESIKTSELIAGESFIAVPKTLPEPSSALEQLDLIELFKNIDVGVTLRNIQGLLRQAITSLGTHAVAQILGCTPKYVSTIIGKNVGISVKKFVELMDRAGVPYDKHALQVGTKGKSLPAIMPITEELCAFFGLWLAEGSYTNKNEVRVSIHEKEVPIFGQLVTRLFGTILTYRKPHSKGIDLYVCSGILGKMMQALGFASGARNKNVPEFAYTLDNRRLAALLRGYISGDGSLNTATPAPMVEIATESPALADDVVYLLLRFGIVAKIYLRKDRPQRRICFADVENLEAFKSIGFFDDTKNQKIYAYTNARKFTRRDQVPISGIVGEIVAQTHDLHAWRESDSIGRNVLLTLQDQRLDAVLAPGIHWDRVLAIEAVTDTPEFVYDISVPGCENFVAGFGGIFAHNSEENIRKKFEEAEKNAPSIIFIDEIDAIAAKREETRGEVERRVVAQMLALMDGLKARGRVVVIAATNVPNILDPALRRPGRFDREIEIGVPRYEGRLNILKIHTRNMPLADNVNLEQIASITHGFVGADLASLAKEAAMVLLRRMLPDLKYDSDEAIPSTILEKLIITKDDFKDALKYVRPSAMREVLVEVPNVNWEHVGGLMNVKQELREAVEWPLKHPEAFKRLGVKPPKGILMYGPPGTGKTMLAKAVATESQSNFILVNGPSLLSKWVGESEKAVRKIFEKARQTAPTIIFFDEIDSLAPHRGSSGDSHVMERVVNQLLSEIDGLESLHDVVIIGATNRPDIMDTALLRPGRFDRIILVPPPELEARKQIFSVHTRGMPLAEDVDTNVLAERAEGYVGADIEAVCREAAILALRKDIKAGVVTLSDFDEAIAKVGPSVSAEIEKSYEELQGQFKQARAKEMKKNTPSYFG